MDATLFGLLQACAETPDDGTPHLILADWLDDHGQPERAELVRVQCRLADWVPDWEERRDLIRRQDDLVAAHRDAWLGPLTGHCHRVEFARGLARVWVAGRTFALKRFGAAFEERQSSALVEEVRLVRTKSVHLVAAKPWFRLFPALSLAQLDLGAVGVAALLDSDKTDRLVRLDLSGNGWDAASVKPLVDSPCFGRLARLDLRNNDLPNASLRALLRASARLAIDAAGNDARPEMLAALAERLPSGRRMNSLGMEFVRVPAGSFLMGSPPDEPGRLDDEGPQRVVHLTRPFWLGRFAVTQQHYGRGPHTNRSQFRGPHRPVEQVTWTEAADFCAALSALPDEEAAGRRYRLPTEAEWEHACRAGTSTAFHTGPTHSMELMNTQSRFTNTQQPRLLLDRTSDVGSYPPNGFGLYDMHGNVWEWCADRHANWRSDAAVTDPTGPATGGHRVARGGCWEAIGAYCRAAKRLADPPETRSNHIGFRVVMELGERGASAR